MNLAWLNRYRTPDSWKPTVSLLSFLFLLTVNAYGQMNAADITGNITDQSGAIIPRGTVTALQLATQEKHTAVTNDVGQYSLPQLPLGEYSVTAEAQGFKQAAQQHLVLHVNDHVRQDFSLEIGNATEMVNVDAGPEQLETQSVSIKDVVENDEVVDLPLKNRQFLQLTLLSEGVVNPPGGTRGDSLQQTGSLINVLGQRTGHNLFLVDGTSITDEYYNNVVLNPSPDATQEFIINKTNYEAEFGGKSGAVINVVTKSGTNSFHGTAYEFLRNDAVDAENYFALKSAPVPAYKENQFGAALGGPIRKNSTFLFVNYDGQRLRQDLAHLFTVPTAAQRAGAIGTTPVAGAFDPAAVALLNPALTPLPNLPGASSDLLEESEQSFDSNQYNVRLDQRLSSVDYVFARAAIFDAHELDPYGSTILNEAQLPAFGRTLNTHTVDVTVGETHTFSTNLLNEFRFGWMKVSGGQGDPNVANPFAASFGLKGTTPNPADQGYPQINLSNQFTTIGSPAGFTSRVDHDFEFFDNVMLHKNTHTIQLGGYFFHLSFNPRFPNNARGVYTYSGAYTGTPLGDFLKGEPASAQVGLGEGAENATTNWAHFYVQDSWQVKPSLVLNLGVRYEYNANLVAQPNQTSNIDLTAPGGPAFVVAGNPAALPSTAALNASLSPIPIVSAQSVGWNNSLLTPRNIRFSPRLGLAWQVPGGHGTVVRAGFGVFTNQASYSILQNLAENMPFFFTETVTAPTAFNPNFSTENILSATNYKVPGTIGASSVNHSFRVEYNEVYNLSVQKAVSSNTTIEAEYIGSRTIHADSSTVDNMPVLPPTGTTSSANSRRPYPQLAAFTTIRWNGWATFNGLTLKANRRFSQDLSFETTYTWSKSIDDASDTGTTNNEYNLPQNSYAPQLESAPSSFDHRNRFTANAVYDLPIAKGSTGLMRTALAGWRASGLLSAQSGAPFTINLSTAAGNEPADVGLVNATTNVERPNVTGNPNNGPHTAAHWFNTASFSLPAPFTFGTAGRNDVFGPGLVDLDFSLQKDFALPVENSKLQFRFDAFNAVNHPNFNVPGRVASFNTAGVQTSPTFGVITSALDPRELQFALKFIF
jgi:Carboxypeptidase regulatory-like domain